MSSRKKQWQRGELEICAILIKHWACTLQHRNSLRHIINPILPMKKLRLQGAEEFHIDIDIGNDVAGWSVEGEEDRSGGEGTKRM